mmetsp:Transcript_4129/g.15985  ORF Transcript_4129/g.15985 Transcript_4129/m.15985 type:complete len:254 (+) Transcript_4129:540-1301(+)
MASSSASFAPGVLIECRRGGLGGMTPMLRRSPSVAGKEPFWSRVRRTLEERARSSATPGRPAAFRSLLRVRKGSTMIVRSGKNSRGISGKPSESLGKPWCSEKRPMAQGLGLCDRCCSADAFPMLDERARCALLSGEPLPRRRTGSSLWARGRAYDGPESVDIEARSSELLSTAAKFPSMISLAPSSRMSHTVARQAQKRRKLALSLNREKGLFMRAYTSSWTSSNRSSGRNEFATLLSFCSSVITTALPPLK